MTTAKSEFWSGNNAETAAGFAAYGSADALTIKHRDPHGDYVEVTLRGPELAQVFEAIAMVDRRHRTYSPTTCHPK